ncbi:hypothetical protein Sme01_39450 [Sphaerisporangium melleum]|uniref:Secreted protein n=1 Tax=Sphaerisporangium melleum TaxID=321316 RepID=A0A917VI82_9ACTN|nr:hypothetical protein [Sphaerisporangium melleum]GGK86136.1 hypothetical protein GCM10007964_30870 [Sphaerisporangium melleum]GII71469.1 hypothetical protein Sme01_39450 [Sphaerisporangium melleum]
MNRLMLLALLTAGAAAGVPAAGASYAAGLTGRDASDPAGGRIEVRVSRVECPSGRADVIMTAPRGRDVTEYSVHRGGTLIRNGVLWPGVQRAVPVYLEPGRSERVAVAIHGQGTTTYRIYSGCETGAGRSEPSGESGPREYGVYRESVYTESDGSSDDESRGESHAERRDNPLRAHRYNPLLHRHGVDRLPYTGPSADLYGKMATAVALVLFGGMLWGVAVIWPRRVPAGPLMRPRPIYGPRRHPTPLG